MASSDKSFADSAIRFRGQGMRLALALTAALAAYFLTIQDIKSELSAKADAETVRQIDLKLSRVEVFQEENRIANSELRSFREEVIERLARIESLLGANRGRK